MTDCERGNDVESGKKPIGQTCAGRYAHRLSDVEQNLKHWIAIHGEVVQRYLDRVVGVPDVAEDLFQEVFLRASLARRQYRERGRSRAYLLRIAQRLAAAHFRNRRRSATITAEQWMVVEPVDPSTPDESLMRNESHSTLARAMRQLPAKQRQVLQFRFFHELDFQSIAKILGCPRNTVFSHCRRGLANLRRCMEADDRTSR